MADHESPWPSSIIGSCKPHGHWPKSVHVDRRVGLTYINFSFMIHGLTCFFILLECRSIYLNYRKIMPGA